NMCEGLVPVRDLADDYYDFGESNYCLVGRRHGTRYRLGDEVKVKVARASLEKKQLDFVLVDDKGIPMQNDNVSKHVSVAQALHEGKKKVNRGDKRKTRSRK
ncbi:MAG: ribonuclease R, partial [Paramuribaculum sp.]|nr:ribonuclease R [Paramuribaculum sp.]